MQTKLNQFMQFLSSLKFSLFIFLFYFILVFVGTIDQVNLGIYYTQKKYFQSLFVNIPVLNFMIPLFPLSKLHPHEQHLFTRLGKHHSKECAHVGAFLPLISGHSIQE